MEWVGSGSRPDGRPSKDGVSGDVLWSRGKETVGTVGEQGCHRRNRVRKCTKRERERVRGLGRDVESREDGDVDGCKGSVSGDDAWRWTRRRVVLSNWLWVETHVRSRLGGNRGSYGWDTGEKPT